MFAEYSKVIAERREELRKANEHRAVYMAIGDRMITKIRAFLHEAQPTIAGDTFTATLTDCEGCCDIEVKSGQWSTLLCIVNDIDIRLTYAGAEQRRFGSEEAALARLAEYIAKDADL